MRLLHRTPSTVPLSLDETAVLIALLDALVDPDLHHSAEIRYLTARARARLSASMAAAVSGERPTPA